MLWIAVVGCADVLVAPDVSQDPELRVLDEGTPDALGVVAMLNDAGTTVTVLDVDARLDVRAARNLVAHRDGGDPFDTVAEIDAVPQVGDAALGLLVDFARSGGWVSDDDALYGVVEGLELTKDQAASALRTANHEGFEVLDVDVALDARAATNLVAKRPFASVEDVALVPYVGASALQHLVDWGMAHPVTVLDADAASSALEAASAGLWFTSESDYPLEVWIVADAGPVTVDNVKDLLAEVYVARPEEPGLDARAVEESSMAWMFDRYTVQQDWWEPSQVEDQPKWQAVRDVFETGLANPQVFRFGEANSRGTLVGAIDVFVFGTTSDGFLVGVRTVSVET